MTNRHHLITNQPLQSGGKFISQPIPVDNSNSIRGWCHSDEDGKMAIFQSFRREGEYRKLYDIPVNKGELTTFNIPTYSRFSLIVFAQGLIGSTEVEIVIVLSEAVGVVDGTRNVTSSQDRTI